MANATPTLPPPDEDVYTLTVPVNDRRFFTVAEADRIVTELCVKVRDGILIHADHQMPGSWSYTTRYSKLVPESVQPFLRRVTGQTRPSYEQLRLEFA